MDTRFTLVRIYLFVCRHYQGRLVATVQRQSNNSEPDFTDEEVLKIATASYLPKPCQKARDGQRDPRICGGALFGLVPRFALLSELQPPLKPAERCIFPACREGSGGDRWPGMPQKYASYRRFDADPCGQRKPSLPSSSRFRTDPRRWLLLLEGHLLPWRETSRCRRAEKRPTPAFEACRTDLWKRKRPSGSAPRFARNREWRPLWRVE